MNLTTIRDAWAEFDLVMQIKKLFQGHSFGLMAPVLATAITATFKLAGDLGYHGFALTPEQTLYLAGKLALGLMWLGHVAKPKPTGDVLAGYGPNAVVQGNATIGPGVPAAQPSVGPAPYVPPEPNNLGQAPIPGQPDLTA
jgi:hypothetical protein